MLFKAGNDRIFQVVQCSHSIPHSLRMVPANHSAPKKLLERVEQLDVSLMLYNCEFRQNLKTGSHFRLPVDADEETSFAVHKSDNPLRFQSSRMRLNVKSLR